VEDVLTDVGAFMDAHSAEVALLEVTRVVGNATARQKQALLDTVQAHVGAPPPAHRCRHSCKGAQSLRE